MEEIVFDNYKEFLTTVFASNMKILSQVSGDIDLMLIIVKGGKVAFMTSMEQQETLESLYRVIEELPGNLQSAREGDD